LEYYLIPTSSTYAPSLLLARIIFIAIYIIWLAHFVDEMTSLEINNILDLSKELCPSNPA
jgi:hypothetical protein